MSVGMNPQQPPTQIVAGEERLLFTRTHPKILFVPVIAVVVVVGVIVLAGLYLPTDTSLEGWNTWAPRIVYPGLLLVMTAFGVWPIVQWWHSTFEVTSLRVRKRWGVFSISTREVNLDRITQVNEERGLIDRIFGAGTILIFDASSANSAAVQFSDVPRVHSVKQLIDDARQAVYNGGQVVHDPSTHSQPSQAGRGQSQPPQTWTPPGSPTPQPFHQAPPGGVNGYDNPDYASRYPEG